MIKLNPFLSNNSGMTLVELIVSLAILGIIMLPVSLLLYVGYLSAYEEYNATQVTEKARTAMTMIMDDLREYDFENSSYDENGILIKHASNNTLHIKTDLLYQCDNAGFLRRNDEIVCEQVQALVVNEYYDNFNSNVIEIKLIIQSGNQNNAQAPIVLKNSYWRRMPAQR